jgi:hypothetical protein
MFISIFVSRRKIEDLTLELDLLEEGRLVHEMEATKVQWNELLEQLMSKSVTFSQWTTKYGERGHRFGG